MRFERHRTALDRTEISRPMRLAVQDGVVSAGDRILDYGCGKGGDVRQLRALGFDCEGWDPVHRPEGRREQSDIVNLGYVVNVVEDLDERAQVLRTAWALAGRVLVVAGRLSAEARAVPVTEFADGYVTRCGTFQKLFGQQELKDWIEACLGTRAATAGPGVFYVFRDESHRQAFLFSRYRRRPPAPRVDRSESLYSANKEILDVLVGFLTARGRVPDDMELPEITPALRDTFGSVKRAVAVVTRTLGDVQWRDVQRERTQDVLVYLALTRFDGRPKFNELPRDLQLDVRAFFTSYQAAGALADALLFSVGNVKALDSIFRAAPIGKLMPAALYVHTSALDELPTELRIYEGCARGYIGSIEGANIIKLHRDEPRVSYLAYPAFDRDPHPALVRSIVVPLQTFRIDIRDFANSANPPVLHRKEEFVPTYYPDREKFRRLTEQEERFGLYSEPAKIGTRAGWEQVLRRSGVSLRGHRVVRAPRGNGHGSS